jgi:hypothetical protein
MLTRMPRSRSSELAAGIRGRLPLLLGVTGWLLAFLLADKAFVTADARYKERRLRWAWDRPGCSSGSIERLRARWHGC